MRINDAIVVGKILDQLRTGIRTFIHKLPFIQTLVYPA